MHAQHSIAARDAAAGGKIAAIDILANLDRLADSVLVGTPVVCGALGNITDVTLWRWIKAGKIPKPRKFDRLNLWRVGDLRAVLTAKEADHAAS